MDTKAFYTEEELEIDQKIAALRQEQRMLKQAAGLLARYAGGELSEKAVRRCLKTARYLRELEDPLPGPEEAAGLKARARELTPVINREKERLRGAMERFSGVRRFRTDCARPGNVVSLFDSALTRALGIGRDELTLDLVVVRTYYFKILRDLLLGGFTLGGERYVYYAASAGQIRTKRSVFIREARLRACAGRLMCGLTVERVNRMGGINVNKYLSYLALSNSATDEWTAFDIRRCIVVDDMETAVPGLVDHIDSDTYEITRRRMEVPICHTDGAGMVLPSISKKNFMVRLPWVKGLLASFPFDKFIREANRADPSVNHGVVRDLYGVPHDVLAEGVQVIFTKSQFKMWRYYDDWEQYQEAFLENGCRAGICNLEEDVFHRAKLNYQMLQTLTDLSDDELRELSAATAETLKKLTSDRDAMLRVFGALPGNARQTPFQEALRLYPELLQDEYCRDTLRMIKAKIEREARAGRLDVEGYFTFLVPDLYAFCQRLFLGDPNPKGLLADGEVSCRLFAPGVELDCLRSPHLYIEHAVRKNIAGADREAKRWFRTDACYLSSHDLISKLLMCDWDGDKGLIVSDKTLVAAAKRNTVGVAPLYYRMAKAKARELTPLAVYESTVAAYTGGNIGVISNNISRIWNSCRKIDLDAVKLLCLENNYVIDYAKTLYKPVRPASIAPRLQAHTRSKVPYFFMEAKGKTADQVAPWNDSCVNRIRKVLPRVRLKFSWEACGTFDWRMLTSGGPIPENEAAAEIVETFARQSSRLHFRFDDETAETNKRYLCKLLRDTLLSLSPDPDFVVDVLVKRLFFQMKSRRKVVFWECFGEEVVRNLRRNVDRNTSMCLLCGARFYREGPRQTMCKACSAGRRRTLEAQRKRRARGASAF